MKTLRKKELKRFRIVATIHKDVTERLEKINASLAAETRKVLDINKSEKLCDNMSIQKNVWRDNECKTKNGNNLKN